MTAAKSLRNYAPWAVPLGPAQNVSLRILLERFRDFPLNAGAKMALETLREINAVHVKEEAVAVVTKS